MNIFLKKKAKFYNIFEFFSIFFDKKISIFCRFEMQNPNFCYRNWDFFYRFFHIFWQKNNYFLNIWGAKWKFLLQKLSFFLQIVWIFFNIFLQKNQYFLKIWGSKSKFLLQKLIFILQIFFNIFWQKISISFFLQFF